MPIWNKIWIICLLRISAKPILRFKKKNFFTLSSGMDSISLLLLLITCLSLHTCLSANAKPRLGGGKENFRAKEKQVLDQILGPGHYDARIRPSGVNGTVGFEVKRDDLSVLISAKPILRFKKKNFFTLSSGMDSISLLLLLITCLSLHTCLSANAKPRLGGGKENFRAKEKQVLDQILGPGHYDARIRPSGVNGTAMKLAICGFNVGSLWF
ncbi:uncharacterized protein LOC113386467 [Ctenocephalides felis]|uniref:uncharacterized protein LOC113386467 n=1 Tax=Ctenocephalides felis TaxID=7515 RepID=UPI000E6E5930|nr:uncharacterized protein LOC113386467 [Ctenocephalides felis]